MLRYATFLILLPGTALAHIGHIGTVAGHDHWVAGAAVGAAVAVGVWGWLQGKKAEKAAEEAEAEADPEAEDGEPEAA